MTGKDKIRSVDLSIIIVNWNAKDLLRDCLSSIYEKTLGIQFEVIVADNASSDGSLQMVRSEFPQVKLLANSENLGFARANNLALPAAMGRYIGVLNPDTVLLNNAFTMMVSKLESEPRIGIAGPRLLTSDDMLDYQCARHFISLRSEFERILGLGADRGVRTPLGNFLPLAEYDNSQEIDCVSGACMVMRRDVLRDGRIFDPRFFMYAEDVDLCYETVRNGWKVFYLSEAHVIHSRGESSGRVSAVLYSMRANYQFFVKRRGYLAGYMYRSLWVIVTMGKLAITWLVRLSPRFRQDPVWMKRDSEYPQMIRYALRLEDH
jgi:GT2 family glycosyltransferase